MAWQNRRMITLRFDMRAPTWGAASTAELYGAALDMAAWGEANGALAIVVSEHHHSEDGYLPSPLVLASALAARTRTTPISVGAVLAPLHDPVRLAEDMVVLDCVSGGRASFVLAVGYRPEEYEMFGQDFTARGKRMDEVIDVLRKAFAGQPFEYDGRKVMMATRPATPGGPMLFIGGHSKPALRRAARHGLGVMTEGATGLEAFYLAECAAAGTQPGMFLDAAAGSVTSAFVAEDPDRAWAEWGPYLLHDAQTYATWMGAGGTAVSKSSAQTVDELRAENGPYRIYTPDEAIAAGSLSLQPLCGGLPPAAAWHSLELIADQVIPGWAAAAGGGA